MTNLTRKKYDTLIIGAGPAGLASLSAISEPYSLDSMNTFQIQKANDFMSVANGKKGLKNGPNKVCVIDPHPTWLYGWKENFDSLEIEFLRSPAMAHPDHFDQNALLAFAVSNGREDELIESGCYDVQNLLPLGQTQVGLWKLPSTSLFQDFCLDLAKRLSHDYIQGKVIDVFRKETNKCSSYIISLADGSEIIADSIILSLGSIGYPITPPLLKGVPDTKIFPWTSMKDKLQPEHEKVLVVGGGLTAVQAAQYALGKGKNVVLCSRRELVERHFDINIEWFDRRFANKHIADFYHEDDDHRLSILREARGGGSVPPIYMNDIRKWQKSGKLTIITADANFVQMTEKGRVFVTFSCPQKKDTVHTPISVFDSIILACGIRPDCNANPLIQKIQQRWPIKLVGGFPCVSEDLEWTKNLFVVGGLASLNTGPDSANLNGIRRSASIVANALQCRCWLRENESKVLSNPFELFWDEDDSSDSDSE